MLVPLMRNIQNEKQLNSCFSDFNATLSLQQFSTLFNILRNLLHICNERRPTKGRTIVLLHSLNICVIYRNLA